MATTASPPFALVSSPSPGGLSLIYQTSGSGGTSVYMATSPLKPTGSTNDWSILKNLPGTINLVSAPGATVVSGTIWILYRGSGDTYLWYANSNNWQNTVIPYPQLSGDLSAPTTEISPALTQMNNVLYGAFVYSPEAPEHYNALGLVTANTTNRSLTWSYGVVSDYITPAVSPAIAVFGTSLFIAYGPYGPTPMCIIRSDNQGQTWTSPTILPQGVTSDSPPALVTWAGNIFLFYVNGTAISYAYSTDGQHWLPPYTLPGGITTNYTPAVSVANNLVYVVYGSTADDTMWITWAPVGPSLVNWAGPFQLPTALTFGYG